MNMPLIGHVDAQTWNLLVSAYWILVVTCGVTAIECILSMVAQMRKETRVCRHGQARRVWRRGKK